MTARLKIGELARRSACPAQTIRYYEREGLLPEPVRSEGNYRLYGAAHLRRLSFIRNCRALDMSLDEIRDLLRVRDLPEERCAAAHALLDAHLVHVAERILELQDLQGQLKSLRRQCIAPHQGCGALDELGRDAGPLRRSPAHIRGAHRR